MNITKSFFAFASLSCLAVSCTSPTQQSAANAGGVFQDPNNPYAIPGVSTQGGGYAPATQTPYQTPNISSAPYQSIPSPSVNAPATIPTYNPPTPSIPTLGGGSSHTVSSGDTLWGLSRKYGVSVDDLRQANGISDNTIINGQTLNIPN